MVPVSVFLSFLSRIQRPQTNPSPEGASVSFASEGASVSLPFLNTIQRPQTNPSPVGAVLVCIFLIRIQRPQTNPSPEGASVSFDFISN